MLKRKRQTKPKRLSNADFNAIYDLIRDGSKAPEVKPVVGQHYEPREA